MTDERSIPLVSERWTATRDPTDGSWEVGYVSERGLKVLLGYGLTEDAARLIAAAPEMLAALEEIVKAGSPSPYSTPAFNKRIEGGRAAIAKARAVSQ